MLNPEADKCAACQGSFKEKGKFLYFMQLTQKPKGTEARRASGVGPETPSLRAARAHSRSHGVSGGIPRLALQGVHVAVPTVLTFWSDAPEYPIIEYLQ